MDETLPVASGEYVGHTVHVVPRASDRGQHHLFNALYLARESLRVLRAARDYDAVVVCTAGYEAFLIARGRRLFCPRTRLVLVDVTRPRLGPFVGRIGPWLWRADALGCIRRGDAQTAQARFGVACRRAHAHHRAFGNVTSTHDTLTITRNGTPAAVVIAADDYESIMETLALLNDPIDQQRIIEAQQAVAAGDVTPGKDMARLVAERVQRGTVA